VGIDGARLSESGEKGWTDSKRREERTMLSGRKTSPPPSC